MSDFDFGIIVKSIPFLLEGMGLTLLLTVFAIIGGLLLGTILALCRLSPFKLLSFLAGSYVNFFRSMPLILVIFWFYFLVPFLLGRPVGGFYSVLIAFIMFEAAYYCEIMRAGIQSVRTGQVYAGQALGLTYQQNMRYVVLPQAFRAMVPILLTQAIILFQDTSLVYVVGLRDFLVAADIIANRDNRLMEMFLTVAVVYFVLCLAGQAGIRKLQEKYPTGQ
ncbi:MAG: amino acid ABC transporter permease [Kiloniellales bacterium]|nr:amino acid ABC transporter permease [Kiloniellales bacterium]